MSYEYGPKGQIMNAQEAVGRNTNSIMGDWVDRGPWIYWDTIPFVGGVQVAQQYTPFNVPIGAQNPLTAAVTTKTKLQTNMVRSGQFQPPRCLLLISIGFYFSSNFSKANIDKVLRSCYMQFTIDDKVFHEGFLQLFPGGAGLSGVTQNSGEAVYVNGMPQPQAMRRFGDWAKYIAPMQQFGMTINFGGGGTAIPTLGADGDDVGELIVFLDGLTDRSVQ